MGIEETTDNDLKETRIRNFVAILNTYPTTMRSKHRTIAYRALATAFGLEFIDIVLAAKRIELEGDEHEKV